MIGKNRQLFASGAFLLDGVLIAASWVAAYWLRFHALGIVSPLGIPPLSLYLWFGAVLTPVALLILRSLHIYRSTRTARLSQEMYALIQGVVAVTALAGLGSYLSRGELSRSVLLLFAAIAIAALCGTHALGRLTLRAMRRNRRNLRHVLIVGTGELAAELERKMTSERDFGFAVLGMVAARAEETGGTIGSTKVLGSVAELQERVGLSGQRFKMYKFRTMRQDAEPEGNAVWSRPGDPRRTRLGSVLRRTSLDELPQLWNVLVGHMSLVGPRPERPHFVKQFRASIPRYMLRHHVKAGITGWAQV